MKKIHLSSNNNVMNNIPFYCFSKAGQATGLANVIDLLPLHTIESIEVMITSLIAMLELPDFDHMTTYTMQFESRDKILLVASRTEIMTS